MEGEEKGKSAQLQLRARLSHVTVFEAISFHERLQRQANVLLHSLHSQNFAIIWRYIKGLKRMPIIKFHKSAPQIRHLDILCYGHAPP